MLLQNSTNLEDRQRNDKLMKNNDYSVDAYG